MCYTFAASAAFVTHLLQGPNCRVRVYAFTLSTLDLTELYFHSKPRCRKRCGAFLGNGWQSLCVHPYKSGFISDNRPTPICKK